MKKFDSINVIPFIDIMLVLLAIVLATASFINQGKIEVKVPQSNSQTSVQQSDMAHLITINEKGEFFYQDESVSIEELSEKLKALQFDFGKLIAAQSISQPVEKTKPVPTPSVQPQEQSVEEPEKVEEPKKEPEPVETEKPLVKPKPVVKKEKPKKKKPGGFKYEVQRTRI